MIDFKIGDLILFRIESPRVGGHSDDDDIGLIIRINKGDVTVRWRLYIGEYRTEQYWIDCFARGNYTHYPVVTI